MREIFQQLWFLVCFVSATTCICIVLQMLLKNESKTLFFLLLFGIIQAITAALMLNTWKKDDE